MNCNAGFVLLFAVAIVLSGRTASATVFWPKPQKDLVGSDDLPVDAQNFQMVQTGHKSDVVQNAWNRYVKYVFPVKAEAQPPADAALKELEVKVRLSDETLAEDTDESYTLDVTADGAIVTAETVYGALHGIETFSQCVVLSAGKYSVPFSPVSITDFPRFKWRGLLIDTSRHWLPLDTLKEMVDALAFSKFNVLHWHIVDAVAFPIRSKTFPDLSQGAWNDKATYSLDDMRELVDFARVRGVRVVPEIDMPGHAYSWGVGYPSITAQCPTYEANPNNIPLSPAENFTFEVVKGLLTELFGVFSDSCFHLGGDELVYDCWMEDPTVVVWMDKMGFSKPEEVEQYFISEVYPWVLGQKYNASLVCWQEVFSHDMQFPSSTIVEVWKDSATLSDVCGAGLKGILAYGWYLDQQACDKGIHYQFEDTWIDMYKNEPTDGVTKNPENIIGGEACMWGEQVDPMSIGSRVWPRTCAAGERLWSAKDVVDVDYAKERLIVHRCRLAKRGVKASPISPDWCDFYDQKTEQMYAIELAPVGEVPDVAMKHRL